MTVNRPITTYPIDGPMQADGHLTDASLLLAIDGELPSSNRDLVKKHVRACWRCRARREHLEHTIAGIVEYEHRLVAPDMPPLDGSRAIFLARLDQTASELGKPLLSWRLLMRACSGALSLRILRFALTFLVVAGGLYLLQQRNTPVVSASELLQRALASESRSLTGISQPVVVQKLSIDINGHKIARTIYRDAVRKRMVQRSNVTASDELTAEHDFGRSHFSWDDPLSPQTYSEWREGVTQKQDWVTQLNTGEIRVDTRASAGPVSQASLTLRSDDYHPVAEEIRLRDNTYIEVAEISYEVVGLSSLGDDFFGSAPHVAAVSRLTTAHAIIPTSAQLEAAELDVYLALHGSAADMGEQITVHRADGGIEVDGITESEARKQQIVSALAGIPFASQKIESVSEAMTHLGPNAPRATHATLVTPTPALLEEQLKHDFPEASQRTEFVARAMSLCQDASAHAWALNRLADRYVAQDVALLEPEERSRLRSLLNDHLSALRDDVQHLQVHLAPIVSTDSTDTNAVVTAPPVDWRADIHLAHESVESTNQAVSSLLIGASGAEDSAHKLQSRLHITLTRLQKELETLEQQKYP
ncbi:hypothetical protein [Terriglobus roseus]|uniref:Zinc-finger n=1 Tax=Terriglobus roseus TaxID=392734 RepID=A0A1G7GQY0_9BACT|nr:hypothetical protein [Terriglobus roseus]SDE90542.1 hypothetical protein SAMN05444167_0772 [Terriglobus roseus]